MNLKLFALIIMLFSSPSFAELGYGIVIQKKLPKKLNSVIANFYGVSPQVGEKIYIPFTRLDYCTAKIESVKDMYLHAKMIDCDYDKVKEGQRLLLARRKATPRKKYTKKPILDKPPRGDGPIYYISSDLGSSTAIVSIPKNSFAPLGAKYTTENIMGAECNVTLIKNDGETGVIDSSSCSFEREFYPEQEYLPGD